MEETLTSESGYKPTETELLETFILSILSENDGLCLDNEEERDRLALVLTNALVVALRDQSIDLNLLLAGLDRPNPPQTS